ncbi:unnamed protein product [Closterium sp. Yama58-4]|nr:unnamed protein product [Closterium sp. Yama58-4]
MTGESEAGGELEEGGRNGEEEEHAGEQAEEQAAAEVPVVASDQPNQRLTAHLDLSEVKRQLQRSNERTAEHLKHLRNRLHASNEWTAKHLKKSNQQTRENLKHLKTHLETHLHASNEWTLSHLRKGHQWTSQHLRESNQRTMEHLKASNQRTREQLQHLVHAEHLEINLKHLEGHLDVGALKARLEASNTKTKESLKRSGRQASHTVHGVADVLSVISAAAAAATAGGASEATSSSASGSAASPPPLPPPPPPRAESPGPGTLKGGAAGGSDGGDVSKTASSASSSVNNGSTAAKSPPARNPYLSGNFRPVGTEVLQELDCAVIGQIPQGLRGRFIRNGPNPQLPPSSPALYHWFDGDGMTKNVSNNHFILHAGRLLSLWEAGLPYSLNPSTLHTEACSTASTFESTQKSPRLLSLWEAGLPYSLNPSTLHTKGVHSFDDTWRSGMTAHPKVDPITNHMMIYGYNLTHKPYLRYGVVDPSGSLVHATDLDLPHPVMMHDFAITHHYSIFLDFPLRFQLDKVIQSHGKAKPFVFDPLADELACDEVARLHEYRLDLQSGAVEERSLCKVCCDFPSINPNFTGRPHRFAYSARFTAQPGPGTTVPSFNAIMKHDFQHGTYQVHTLPPGRFCGEPVFAPCHHFQSRSRVQSGAAWSDAAGMGKDVVGLGADAVGMGAEVEDDGWVLAHVWDEEEMRSEVIVLDAMNLDKLPLARVILPKRVPYGFHGTFLPD